MFLFRKFTFWLSLISILICLNNFWGNDDKNILLIGLNPVLNSVGYTEPFRHWMFDFSNESTSIKVQFPAYLLHFSSFFLLGFIIDYLKKMKIYLR